ncbi:hypothetical protein [Glaciibacter psychrotolerans]|uniref:Large exoprotein n=1 Tax=Glaciibacter psychrotolerans TaxID=670054 RepID=A0A7Z0J4E5_9MICO|nr:hypothetical protein [Leifsonia psychrotolerans]NYJ18307.1 hypothetical protein [Leifsonia psychrotolerans]
MSGEVLGGGVMVAVAAALWVAYFMPTWARRRQYFAMERNAVRLQQTLRILAETAEVPEQVRLEANARTVSSQQKLLAQAEAKARAELKISADAAVAARRAAVVKAAAVLTPVTAQRALGTLRRQRALRSLLLLVGVVAVVAGTAIGLVGGSWLLLGFGGLAAATALGGLARLARTARFARSRAAVRIDVAAAPTRVHQQRFEPVHFDEAPVVAATWTPKPLPRPMYLTRGSIAQAAMASVDAGAELRKAASEAELSRRAAEREAAYAAAVTPITRPTTARPAASAASSAFASMGIIGDTEPGMSNLDDVLRRRRAAG